MKKFTVVTMLLLALNAMASIQYVESTGAQYIKTGVAYTNTLRIVADFEFTQIPSGKAIANVVAWRSSGNKEAIACGSTYFSGAQYFCSQFSDSSAYKRAAIMTDTNRHVFDIQNGSQKLDGVEFGTDMLTIPSSAGSLYVFCSNIGWSNGGVYYADFSSIRLYSCKIYVGDELIRDYIPYAQDGVAGLYDKVGNSFTAPALGTLVPGPYNGDKLLKVSISHSGITACTPAVGKEPIALADDETLTCSAASVDTATTKATLTGYYLYDIDKYGNRLDEGQFVENGTSYTHQTGDKEIEWIYDNVKYKVDATFEGGSISHSSPSGWYNAGEIAYISPINGTRRYCGWDGEIISNVMKGKRDLSILVDKPVSLSVISATPWVYDAGAKVLSNDLWTITAETVTQNGNSGLRLRNATKGTAVLDLTDVEADTNYKVIGCHGKANYVGVFTDNAAVKTGIVAFIGPDVVYFDGGWSLSCVFEGCVNLAYVRLSPDFYQFGRYAFNGCKSLEEIFPTRYEKCVNLGRQTFAGCGKLKGDFVFEILESFDGDYGLVFKDCASVTSVSMPKLKSVNLSGIFYNCTSITNINIPEVTSINSSYGSYSTFYGVKVKHFNLPKLKTIEGYTFYGCNQLETLYVPELEVIKNGDNFSGNKLKIQPSVHPKLRIINSTKAFNSRLAGDYEFPALTNLSNNSFYYSSINSLTATNLITLSGSVFEGCSSLTNLVFGNKLKTLNGSICKDCTALRNFEPFLPDNLEALGNYCFYNCGKLEKDCVKVNSELITSILEGTFYKAGKISRFEINAPIASIGKNAFNDIMPGAEIVFGKNATTAPTVWNATHPIRAKSAPYAKIIVMKNIGSWTALSNFTSIENVADTYKTAAYGYTGDLGVLRI